MWKTISSKTVFTHPRIKLVEDIVELPGGSQVPYLRYSAHNDAAEVICIKNNKILLQKEYSYPPNEILYQFPGGRVNDGETPKAAAAREFVEEAGLKAVSLQKLGWFYVDNRRTNAKLHVYLATATTLTKKVGGDHEEVITSHWLPISTVDIMIKNGEITNYSLLSAWALYKANVATVIT